MGCVSLITAGQAGGAWAWQGTLEYRGVPGRGRKWHRVWRRETSQGQGEAWDGIVQAGHARSVCLWYFPVVQLELQPFPGCRVSCAQSLQRAAEMLAPRLGDQQMVSLKRA